VETVLVTGGTGFIGGWCIVALRRRGYAVRTSIRDPSRDAAVRSAIASAAVPTDRLTSVRADLTSDAGWDAAVAGCDYVLHIASPLGRKAARDAQDLIVPARDGTIRVLGQPHAGVRRVVMTSAAAAARPPQDRIASPTKPTGRTRASCASMPTGSPRCLPSAPPGI
jgi:nucleoside-diphosphate-sugar epimerase